LNEVKHGLWRLWEGGGVGRLEGWGRGMGVGGERQPWDVYSGKVRGSVTMQTYLRASCTAFFYITFIGTIFRLKASNKFWWLLLFWLHSGSDSKANYSSDSEDIFIFLIVMRKGGEEVDRKLLWKRGKRLYEYVKERWDWVKWRVWGKVVKRKQGEGTAEERG
jgi:hypothetical protein